jgi:hypothetical protein
MSVNKRSRRESGGNDAGENKTKKREENGIKEQGAPGRPGKEHIIRVKKRIQPVQVYIERS